MRTLTLDGVDYLLPGKWNELNDMQLLALGAQMGKAQTPAELKAKLLLLYLEAHVFSVSMTGGKLYTLKIGKHNHKLTSGEVLDISQNVFGWMTKRIKVYPDPKNKEDWEWEEQLHSELTRAPYAKLPCSCHEVLVGAADGMTDITWEQFGLLQTYHSMMMKNRSANLDRLIAVLFRKAGTEFDASKIDKYAAQVEKVSAARKEVMLLWYYGVLNFMAKKFPTVFSGGGTPPADVYKAHLEGVNALAKGDVTKFGDVMRANLYDVLYHLEAQIKENERLKKEMQAAANKKK